ncbi:M50 family metallopeptidase [Clostridium saccharoperbutylacetonicum]|jgi:regulator of sigma E protease|uniref:RIP metalloprotease RasP n=1 Tax=Clostridium saccharoperbutylacetonicum N1-4(HMT) TaxID=931276 RepID=M1MJU9_9CLOT|nr:M50 family metallopeptidase [Clostridium saccharoperbutylacetonicum]AGF55106.1 RIP metalloprotease RasP [Clostridium saccharoperbutylacetonicum N1-4(HMT)]AQR93995.1 metalloprotease MmpA [Clostridium saccharoperbutylacetonicum]NRT64185.1 regulator of sigma E protease [Clostridium saccharoperbutylacetonicum]NSB27552.1 regulator of sigma E protease [Clostridium saccharoperbutylacetonicum]NSB29694.1 regulator of sigma E protease [Clostridium saccharoperbutylacetonicum]
MYVIYLIMAILAFGVLIIVHELGHFTLAKLNGVRVEEFSLGMGPRILSKQGKETRYSLSLFPIGGYVKMMGEEEAVEDERSFSAKSPLRRISIIIAGVVMNYLLAICIFTAITFNFGYTPTIAGSIEKGSPAYEAGLMKDDKILKISNSKVFSFNDILTEIYLSKGDTINFLVDRNGEMKEVAVTPKINDEGQYKIGMAYPEKIANPGIGESFKESLNETVSLVSQTFKGLKMIFTGKADLKKDVGGPLTIVKMSAETAKTGIWNLVYFVGFLSVNLAVFNLLPFPALDGGWCVILLIELITRRKVPDKIVGVINYIGFAALIGLMILVTIKDILFPVQF